ncbi:hypothetical protein AGMMS49983_09560 [Clostridia bacterium]|nr:hypothetical protein AGMMS49983_09560 [Clostridia bacterium]
MVQTLSQTVVLPIAGLVITYVLVAELIGMITDKNSLHDVDTFMFFKWFFKAWVAVFIVAHTFDITMAIFDVGHCHSTKNSENSKESGQQKKALSKKKSNDLEH